MPARFGTRVFAYACVALCAAGWFATPARAAIIPIQGVEPPPETAPPIGLNFLGGRGGVPGSALAPTDVAGVIPQANWNNLPGPSGNDVPLLDATGAPTGAVVRWGVNDDRMNTIPASGGPNQRLMDGYLDPLDAFNTRARVEVLFLPEAFRRAIGLIIYMDSEATDGNIGQYFVYNGPDQIVSAPIWRDTTNVNSQAGFFDDATRDGIGNYMYFEFAPDDDNWEFVVEARPQSLEGGGFGRAPINGIQIFVIPEPGQAALLGVALPLLLRRRAGRG